MSSETLPEILLSNGQMYNFLVPDQASVTIEVVAHSLSMQCRFTGHTSRFYSVAEHCVRASYIGPSHEALERLMHDAGEALVGDIATPLKNLLLNVKEIEVLAEVLLAEKFGYQYPYPSSVKVADLIMLATEKRDLMPHDDRNWAMLNGISPLPNTIPSTWDCTWWPQYWKEAFLDRFHELTAQRTLAVAS